MAQVEVYWTGGGFFRQHTGRSHNGEDGQCGLEIGGVDVGFEECFVMVKLEGISPLTKDAEYICGEPKVAIASGGV